MAYFTNVKCSYLFYDFNAKSFHNMLILVVAVLKSLHYICLLVFVSKFLTKLFDNWSLLLTISVLKVNVTL